MRDAYEQFFAKGYITKQQFFEFGHSETIYAPMDKAEHEWKALKNRILNNDEVYIRGFGRDASGTQLFIDLYRSLFGQENVTKDPTNNAEPTKMLTLLTGYSKSGKNGFEHIQNYQVSHIFGRTKNIYTFTAPWNIAYIPKILDPFTGHEARGEDAREYRSLFQRQAYDRFHHMIEDFNDLMQNNNILQQKESFLELLTQDKQLDQKKNDRFKRAIEDELRPISPPNF